jgi:HAE1 family hydrophobic/amphiphilic exporter-1
MLRVAIQRPIAVSMLFVALVLIGVLSYKRLPVDLLPSITYPRLTVVTTYEDIPAEDLERMVTQPLEEVVTALAGVRRVESRTRESVSTITVEFEWGVQMDFANLHLREAIDRVAFRDDFPEEASRPVILRWDPTSRPISVLVIRGEHEMETLTEFAREVLKPALEQVDGISQAEVVGGAEREILVRPLRERLAIYDVDIEDIRSALVLSNVTFPGGKIRQGPLHLSLRISGEFESLDQIRNTNIPREGQTPIRISDVAEVLDTVKEPQGGTLLGADPVVSVLIYKEPDANTILASREVDAALEVLKADYADLDYTFIYRDAEYVRASFQGLVQSLILGAVLAFAVLFFFLRDPRSPVVVGLSIPVSIAITFALLYFGKVKLNLMSLGGLSLAAGMLVDNAIVVLENITRHLREQERPGTRAERRRVTAAAAEIGTREVARPVVAATLTTVAVFFPVVYVPGIAGAFFRDQALTVTFSLLISVTTALLLQPMLSARVLTPGPERPRGPFRVFAVVLERAYNGYHRVLLRALDRPRFMLGLLALALVAAGIAGTRLERSFMPERTSGDLRLDLELPPGTPLEQTEETAASLASWIEGEEGVKWVFSQVGETEKTLAALKDYAAPNTARIRIIFELERGAQKKSERLEGRATQRLEALSGVTYAFREEGIGLGEILGSGEAPFSLGVVAEDPREALEAAERIAGALAGVPGLVDLQIDRILGTPNVVVRLNREEILRSGLDPERIGRELRNRVAGVEATTFNEVEQRIDIAVRLPEADRKDLPGILASPVAVSGGRTVPLRTFVTLKEERPVRELVRRNQRRMVTLTADVRGRSVDAAGKDAMAAVAALSLPPSISVISAGERDAMRESFADLGWAMLLAVLLVYMILAAQFESFLDPLLIAAVIPIGLAGAVIAVGVTGNSINILSMIGAVALLGIAVNDAIVKLDTVRRLRAEGMPGLPAILEASRLRFRPILMTSATTVLAMIPMAIGLGSGEQLQRPLAITIIGGLALTTVTTLIYTPILYKLAHRIGREPEAVSEAMEA